MLEEGGGGTTGLLNKGGGSNRLPGLVTKQQAMKLLVSYLIIIFHLDMNICMQPTSLDLDNSSQFSHGLVSI